MHGFLEIDEFQEMLGKMLRKWLKIVFFKNQEDIRMAVFRWFNNNIWCIFLYVNFNFL